MEASSMPCATPALSVLVAKEVLAKVMVVVVVAAAAWRDTREKYLSMDRPLNLAACSGSRNCS